MERHVENAQKVAEYLSGRDEVEPVNYAGLPDSPWHERATELGGRATAPFRRSSSKVVSKPGRPSSKHSSYSHVANIGDVRSLVIHPASTTHSQLTEDEQATAGVSPGLIRLSVGIEHIDDIIADLEKGFAAV